MRIGFYPFWFWNDRLSADEVRWQVREMADKGLHGFFIHSRQGLQQPYLSEAFFEMVDAALAAAEEHDLLLNLYDEYPYPSGVAGGEVILGCPQYHATHLVQKAEVVAGGEIRLELPQGKVLHCAAYPIRDGQADWAGGLDLRDRVGMVLHRDSYVETGLTRYNQKRYFASEPTPTLEAKLPEGAYKVCVAVQSVVHHHKYWDQFVDALNPEAIQRFISLTHERYYKRYADRFGDRIPSIFVDETTAIWSDRVPAAFLARHGYDLLPLLPALQERSHPQHVRVSYDLHQLLYEMFCQSFEGPISAWCQGHGIAYTGEKPSLRLAQLRHMDIPGCEPGHTKAGAPLDILQARIRQNARATASAAYFYDKPGSLCECYHSTGWSATLQDAKLIAEGLLLLGTTYLVPHGFFYSTHALRKHDAPPTFFFQMPSWPLFGRLSQRIDRIAEQFAGTHMDASLLVVEPASGIPNHDQLARYEAILQLLMGNHLDYLMVDTDILAASQVKDGRIHAKGIVAKAVLVPPMQVIEPPLQTWLDSYSAAGGAVIRDEGGDLAALRAQLLQRVRPSLRIRMEGQEAAPIWSVKRAGEGVARWFLLNTGRQALELELDAGVPLVELPLDDQTPTALRRAGTAYRRRIAPFESLLLSAAPEAAPLAALPVLRIPGDGAAAVRPLHANVLRLYHWELALQGAEGAYGPAAEVPAVPLANQIAFAHLPIVPEIHQYFGHAPELHWPRLRARYTHRFQCEYGGRVELVMEPGSLVGDWQILVNGKGPLTAADLAPTQAHVRGSLGVDITQMLRPGENEIVILVDAPGAEGGLVNALYLAGEFGVLLEPERLVKRQPEGLFEDYEGNRLPYYAGTVEYVTSFELAELPSGEVEVELAYQKPFREAAAVSINGSPWVPVPWEPRRFRLESRWLRQGRNALTTRVHTTLSRAFEGQWFDDDAHVYRRVGETA